MPYNQTLMEKDFLDRLASQLRVNKTAACRRAIQRILSIIKNNYETGKYSNYTEAENDFRELVKGDLNCQ
jgi:hypothetical protein